RHCTPDRTFGSSIVATLAIPAGCCPRAHRAPRLSPRMSHTPHHALFKAVFDKPEHARGALRSALPVALAEALDWPTLASCAGSFVDAALRPHHTDLLFSVAWRDGGEALVYLLFEHQSTSDAR